MHDLAHQDMNHNLETQLKLVGVGVFIWNFLSPDTQDRIRSSAVQAATDLQKRKSKKDKQGRLKQDRDMITNYPKPPQSPVQGSIEKATDKQLDNSIYPKVLKNQAQISEIAWQSHISHPSVVLILGKRGSGKSALGYFLLELLRYKAQPNVVGLPSSRLNLLPDCIGVVATLEDLPANSVALVDEAYLAYHARGSMVAKSKAMSQALNLSRQREQTLLFVSQEARQIDKNISSSADVVIFKDLGMLQLEFERPQLRKVAAEAKQAFKSVIGDKRRWSFVYAPGSDFVGLLENPPPSFWKPELSRLFATNPCSVINHQAKKLTVADKTIKARELRDAGFSYREVARELGVTASTALNYVRGYPVKPHRR